jgi:hypothetical protein
MAEGLAAATCPGVLNVWVAPAGARSGGEEAIDCGGAKAVTGDRDRGIRTSTGRTTTGTSFISRMPEG